MIKRIVYHGSNQKGLKVIQPRISSHGKSYVYGTTDEAIATLFLARWNDYIFRVGHSNEKLYIVENYPGALEEVYKNKVGYIYRLNGEDFFEEKDMWGGEVVSKEPARVLDCETIENIQEKLYEHKENGILEIYEYPKRPSCCPIDDSDLIEKLNRAVADFGEDQIEKFLKYHPHLEIEAEKVRQINQRYE